jgi:uncharacterized protein YqgV (UPF0045/DUF77 family)
MTVFGFLSVAPVREGSMAEDVAAAVAALEEFPVSYETTPMGTVIEAEDVGDLLSAVDAGRVSTFLKIDDKRGVDQSAGEKVDDVEAVLGHEARRGRGEVTGGDEDRSG